MQRHSAVIVSIAAMVAAMAFNPAQAQDSWWYVGGTLNYAEFAGPNRQDTGWRGFFGYEFTPNYAFEFGYSDLGSIRQNIGNVGRLDFSAKVMDIGGIGAFDMSDRVSMFGMLGWFRDETTWRVTEFNVGSETLTENNSNYTYAIGIRFNIRPNFAVRGSWQRYRKVGDATDIDVYGVGVVARFGGR